MSVPFEDILGLTKAATRPATVTEGGIFFDDTKKVPIYGAGGLWNEIGGDVASLRSRVKRSSSVALSAATRTSVALNAEDYDPYVMHDTSTNSERITVPASGVYKINGKVTHSQATAFHDAILMVRKSGVDTQVDISTRNEPNANGDVTMTLSGTIELAAGEYVWMTTYSTNACNIQTNNTWLEVVQVGGTTASAAGALLIANKSGTKSVNNATFTKVDGWAVTDPRNWWDNTNNRWVPQIPGWYAVHGALSWNAFTSGSGTPLILTLLYKNGTQVGTYLGSAPLNTGTNGNTGSGSALVWCNGTTDYLELYAYQSYNAAQVINAGRFDIQLAAASETVANEPWTAPSLVNSWVNTGGSTEPAGYRKLVDGRLELRGMVRSGTANTIFTLPVGYRPVFETSHAAINFTGGVRAVCEVKVLTSGVVEVRTPSSFPTTAGEYVSIRSIHSLS